MSNFKILSRKRNNLGGVRCPYVFLYIYVSDSRPICTREV